MLVRPDTTQAILIFIVAYRAEKHIRCVLDRIPSNVLHDPRVHVLCIDDASSDSTSMLAKQWAIDHQANNITVLKNPVNQGYGGNQKLGYRLAIDAKYDFIILLHGDGQYAPELLPEFIETWENEQADVVLGSRMQNWSSARKGGMPFYKALGNRVLTWFQNRCTGLNLSEYHTGYRGYSTQFLSRVPFEANTNNFHFDTEILLQALHVKASVKEFPISTHYGDEVCHVNGMSYAWNVFKATLQYKMHEHGMLCSLKYRNLLPLRERTRPIYPSQERCINFIKKSKACRILEITRETGFLQTQLPELNQITSVKCDTLNDDIFSFDAIVMHDVLEKQAEPEEFLVGLRNRSRMQLINYQPPSVLITTPNIAFWFMRLNLLLGRFGYSERGILNTANKRLFTKSSLKRCLRDSGYRIESFIGLGAPFQTIFPNWFGKLLGSISQGFAWLWPSLFAFQFFIVCRPLPGVNQVLNAALPITQPSKMVTCDGV